MSTHGILDAAVRGEAFVEPLTTEQYHRLIETVVLAEGVPIELIDGILVRKDRRDSDKDSIMTVGPEHGGVCQRIARLLDRLVEPLGHHARCQQPIHLPPQHEPEPDATVVRGDICAYDAEHPGVRDVVLVVEVADSSLTYDRGRKLEVYATAELPEYWIINLSERWVEVYSQPESATATYASRRDFKAGQTIEFAIEGKTLSLDVDAIFPQ